MLQPEDVPMDIVGDQEDQEDPPVLDTGLQNAFATSNTAVGFRPLLQADVGGLYVPQMTYDSFISICDRLLPAEVEKGENLIFDVDVKKIGKASSLRTYTFSASNGQSKFSGRLQKRLANPKREFRVRFGGEASRPFKDSDYRGGSIKLTAENIGYAWIDADWGNEDEASRNTKMVIDAIAFLFPRTTCFASRFTIRIPPDKGSHDVEIRNAQTAVKPNVQAILAELTGENKDNADPVEIFISPAALEPGAVSVPSAFQEVYY